MCKLKTALAGSDREAMPRSPFGWALTIAVPVLVVGFGFVVVGGGTTGSGNTGPSVQEQISAVCNEALREAREVNHSPRTITKGLRLIGGGSPSTAGRSPNLKH